MQTFTDITGHKWTVSVSIGTVKRVKMRLGINMLETETFAIEGQDLLLIYEILYVVCQDEAEKLGITNEEQFLARLAGASLRESKDAFWEAYSAFFPDPGAQEKIRLLIEKSKVLSDRTLALVEKKMPKMIERLDREIEEELSEREKQLDQAIASTFGTPSTKPQGSSASTRRRSRSAK